jgi:hypothetical protein
MKRPFDPDDPEDRRRMLLELRVAADDIDGVVVDMFTKKRRRPSAARSTSSSTATLGGA